MEIEALVEFFADIDVGEAYNVFFFLRRRENERTCGLFVYILSEHIQ